MDLEKLADWQIPRFSWDFEDLPEPTHWFLMAQTYLDCSHHLLEAMMEEHLDSSFHHAKVAVATFEHAIELFLKGAISRAGGPVPTHHRAMDLLVQYRKLYPGKEFEFSGKIDQAVSDAAVAPRNQYARYPKDNKGQPWTGHTHIDLSTWYREIRPFKEDFVRLVPLTKARYPHKN